jgi:energy-coupling factor transporter transmembrane protein EcfT
MEEKILIEGKRNSTLAIILMLPSALFALIGLVCLSKLITEEIPWPYVWYTAPNFFIGLGFIVFALILWFAFSKFSKSKITVTSKRVYGCAAFGKRVDLPIDSISAVSIGGIFSQIAVATASGLIHFYLIENHTEVHKTISDLLVNRQEKNTSVVQQIVNQTSAVELKEYKELLDSGVITQEEFDAKKKQLLGL